MHSPLLANLLLTLRPGEEGLLAVTLPLPYVSVSSMLATLGEGGNLDQLGEAAHVLGFGNNMMSERSASSQVTMRKRNAKQIEEESKEDKSSLDCVEEDDQQLTGVDNMLSSASFAPTKVSRNGRNLGNLERREIEKGGKGNHGEAVQTVGKDVPSVATMDSRRNPRSFQRLTEIQEGGSLVIVGNASTPSSTMSKGVTNSGTKSMPSSTMKTGARSMLSSMMSTGERNPSVKAHSRDAESDSNSSLLQKTTLETSAKDGTEYMGEYSGDDATGTFSGNEVLDMNAKDIKIESENFGDITTLDRSNYGDDVDENLEEVFIDIIEMNTDVDSRQSQGESGPPGTITPGLTFPDYDSMMASLDKWSRDNFSPLVKKSSAGIGPGNPRPYHIFCCPHKAAHRSPQGSGKRRPRTNMLEYVDCPFLIRTKVNADGSCVVTRAVTEHSGHPVSEEQFQKYCRWFILYYNLRYIKLNIDQYSCKIRLCIAEYGSISLNSLTNLNIDFSRAKRLTREQEEAVLTVLTKVIQKSF